MKSRMNNAEKWMWLEEKIMEITQLGLQIKKKKESNLRDLWDNVNQGIIGIPQGEEKEKEIENVLEIMAENVPNWKEKKKDIQIQEAQRVPIKINPNRRTSRHILIKMAKAKERFLKTERGKQTVNYRAPLVAQW